jgi:NADH-quinone oxidoreductase subunit F
MNFEKVLASAAAKSSSFKEDDSTSIFVSARADDSNIAGVVDSILTETKKHSLKASVFRTGSFGYYDLEPILSVQKPGQPTVLYKNVNPEIAARLINDYLVRGNPNPDMALAPDTLLFQVQNRVVLRNCGYIDPKNIDHYIQRSGYSGLAKALKMDQNDLIEELKKSGLRSTAEDNYLIADKLSAYRNAEATEKYIIGNALDADPQALTSRLLLESDLHSILEGLLIAAYAIGASRCIIYVGSGVDATSRLSKALAQMKEYSLLGGNILDSNFDCEIEIRELAASLVLGEETAILRLAEGKQAMPYIRTLPMTVDGFSGKPALVVNAEALSAISAILQNGAGRYAETGTATNKGTKVITMAGDVAHKYTAEVPFGAILRSLVEGMGGGTPDGKAIKAVQFGGPTGTFFAAASLDVSIDYESMKQVGSTIGSGTLRVFDSDNCAVEMTRDVTSFIHSQSCGKCVFCREGSQQLVDILQDIAEGRGKPQDVDLLLELGEAMKAGSICRIGQTSANPVLSSIKLFSSDYNTHIQEKRCPVGNKVLSS